MGKKIGILGGTFNPIHIGHLLLGQTALEEIKLDSIIFMPSGISYMKETREILPGKDRLNLIQKAIADNPNFQVSDLEIKREGYTYTYETLEELGRQHPENHYYFIMGADCLYTIETWKNPEKIFQSATLVAAFRGDYAVSTSKPEEDTRSKSDFDKQIEKLTKKFGGEILLLSFPRIDISSSQIRNNVQEGRSIRYMVTSSVLEEITKQGYYKKQTKSEST